MLVFKLTIRKCTLTIAAAKNIQILEINNSVSVNICVAICNITAGFSKI